MRRHDLADIIRGLEARIGELARICLPSGHSEGGRYWAVGSLAGEKGQSLKVTLTGERRGKWRDFASGEFGDALDLVAETQTAGDKRRAIAWARDFLGLGGGDAKSLEATRRALVERRDDADEREDGRDLRRQWAHRLWLAASAEVRGTAVERYLAGRNIGLAELGRIPRSLRYHPSCWHRASGRRLPAMLAAIVDAEGAFVATHRTWLADDGERATKADVRPAKATLGDYAGGAIRLWRGASRRPLRAAPPDETVVITEGIEDGLTLALEQPQHRYLAAVALANVGNVVLPGGGRVILYLDRDDDPRARAHAQRQVARAVQHFRAIGREVLIAYPPAGAKDANEARQRVLEGG